MLLYLKWLWVVVSSVRLLPHYLCYLAHKEVVDSDVAVSPYRVKNLLWLLTYHKDFRNLFYNRVGSVGYLLNVLAPRQFDLFINRGLRIGKRCCLVHAHTTHLNAKSIGDNFMCFHLVTVGDAISPHGIPTIGNNVTICCNASVLGGITIGNNVTIAAGAVVINSVPDNCVMGGYLRAY